MFRAETSLWLLAIFVSLATCSEYPERECCDLTTTEDTSTEPLLTSLAPKPGSNTKATVAILNCITARQLCFNDSSCAAILEIIPRVCGPEVVACSTITVTKCQAALRTLQAFPFFKPTCLCREPHMDPDCNSFRDFLFDHPCVFVKEKEKDPYPVESLPTCTHAHQVCQQEPSCIKLYEDFKTHCKVRDNKCRMEDRELCFESWTALRRSPIFGCICPNNHMKKRCDRMFSMVNHNPCVAWDNTSASYLDEIGDILLKNPLVDSANGQEAHADYDHISINILKNDRLKGRKFHYAYPEEEDTHPIDHPNHHLGPSSNSIEQDKEKLIFQSTCHSAMDNCNNNYQCRMLLGPILHHCDINRCHREHCMKALQNFYKQKNFPWNVEIAFCLCKKTDRKHDPCLIAQEKLHPPCAQRTEEIPPPTCLRLAETCKENNECRIKLEYFEQSCAVDTVTKKCAGSPSECRKSIMGILGTDLRTTCACKGTDVGNIYECLGWQRLLWVNPCVVEAQKHFHMKKATEQSRHSTHTPTRPTTTSTTTSTSTTSTTTTTTPSTVRFVAVRPTTTEMPFRTPMATEFLPPPQAFVPTSTTMVTTMLTTVTTMRTPTTKRTRATTTTTTAPPRSCIVQRPQFPDQLIREGSFKRIYHEDEFECSDICECELGEILTCRTICIDRMPCKTEFAFYNHAAPAYQAFRGRCLCYSGRFICMKPSPTDYSLPHGTFLFLGYSEVDERELNKNHTTHLVVIQDVARVLQAFIREEADKGNGTLCTLEFFNSTRENVILVGRLSDEIDTSKMTPLEIWHREKEECAEYFELITERVNNRHSEFLSHVLLSVFKMAEIEIVPMETSAGPISSNSSHLLTVIFLCLTKLIQMNLTIS
ncbi:uncharacterized protein LOC126743654 isoform X2 [Anthonomus grandis grandis]|uniref:uncharacterized protein LOC126743654 isoform X2 n=1 Tax=Anthonomus grandis grandis TaxID=2921223 RepID=UPI002165F893|nr:uncharacterized protein LOC126743654 isoform X2 [Anthonomus grandis grandis]